jgi:hypothetical protein
MNASMLALMTRLTIAVPDELAEKIKVAAGGNVSGWFASLARDAFLADSAAQHAAWYTQHPTFVEDAEAERHAA